METVLEVRALTKRYGERAVLSDVALGVPRGTLALVTGRSGSGKSTLFKLLAGLDRPTEGSILVEGRDLAKLSDDELSEMRLRRLGLVFQSFNLLPDLTVRENVRLPLDIAETPRAEAQARVDELLDLLHVEPLAEKLPHTLSGGEQQRVAIARALSMRPAIILADEPTGNLDRRNAENVLTTLQGLNRMLGATILIITHDPLAMQMVPDHYEIDDGRVAWKGGMLSSAELRAAAARFAPAEPQPPQP